MNTCGFAGTVAQCAQTGDKPLPSLEPNAAVVCRTRAETLISSLSKGYQQRVGIAQAIIHDPDVIVLDEPTVGLDPNQIREIRSLIRELGNDHSVILSTHILPEVEAVCDRVHILHNGKVVFADAIAGLRQFRGGHSIQISLRHPPAADEIARLVSSADVDSMGDGVFRISPQDEETRSD